MTRDEILTMADIKELIARQPEKGYLPYTLGDITFYVNKVYCDEHILNIDLYHDKEHINIAEMWTILHINNLFDAHLSKNGEDTYQSIKIFDKIIKIVKKFKGNMEGDGIDEQNKERLSENEGNEKARSETEE